MNLMTATELFMLPEGTFYVAVDQTDWTAYVEHITPDDKSHNIVHDDQNADINTGEIPLSAWDSQLRTMRFYEIPEGTRAFDQVCVWLALRELGQIPARLDALRRHIDAFEEELEELDALDVLEDAA